MAAAQAPPGDGAAAGSDRKAKFESKGSGDIFYSNREAASKLVHRHSMTSETSTGSGQGTLMGVIFPCMANILGVLLFLRLPWIVGKAGILYGFMLVLVCCCCTFLTTLSLSAVATNGKIRGGGAYFLISRSLGPALGAGVGLCFYMANSIGAAMYFMGTVEAWEIAAPSMQILEVGNLNNIRVTGFAILVAALFIVAGGIKMVAKLGTVFLFIVLGVIVCMYLGCLIGPTDSGEYDLEMTYKNGSAYESSFSWEGLSATHFADNFWSAYDEPQAAFPLDEAQYGFISLMALWFPAVTGIMAGSNRSADLKDPAGSIPKGTLTAQGITSIIYLSFVVLYGSIASRETLLGDKFFASSSAWPLKEVVLYGVMASTIGAGLTSLVSGTRLLSAIAGDKTLPVLAIFAVQPGKEPRLALVASGILCALAISIGELNAVAPVLTMFFLMCYTCVNMSCTILEAVHDPNWRPRFKYHHWSVSLVGAILCVWMMFAISPIVAMIAIVFCSCIFAYATKNSHEVKWGDGFQGIKFQLARNILTHMDITAHTKNWRPQLLVITSASIKYVADPEHDGKKIESLIVSDMPLLNLASQLKGGRGLTILGGICSTKHISGLGEIGPNDEMKALDGQQATKQLMKDFGIEGFGRVVYTEDYSHGVDVLVQTAGLGAFQPNCVLSTWPSDWRSPGDEGIEVRSHLIRLVQVAVTFNKVVLLSKGLDWPEISDRVTGTIDIWWIVGDGGILLLLPFLMSKHRVWHSCKIRLFVLAFAPGDDVDKIKEETQMYVVDFRLNIEVHVVVVDEESFPPIQDDEILPPAATGPGHVDSATGGVYEGSPAVHDIAGTDSKDSRGGKGTVTVMHASGIDIEVPRSQLNSTTGIMSDCQPPGAQAPGRKPGGVTAVDEFGVIEELERQYSASGPVRQTSKLSKTSSNGDPHRQISTSSFHDGITRWRLGENIKATSVGENVRANSFEKENPYGVMSSMTRQVTPTKLFPNQPPGVQQAQDIPSAAGGDAASSSDRNTTPVNEHPIRAFSLNKLGKPVSLFLSKLDQLKSEAPCSEEELVLAAGMNRLMVTDSLDADLVVTNLPDMPPNESAYGYFQLVEAMTLGLKRVILVRGTAMEVITAFT